MKPNILLVVFDTARLDALEPYGAASGSTPVIADLASRGWAAPHAYSTSNWTLPSHASMLTGELPRRIGFAAADSTAKAMEGVADRLLPAVLAKEGYATAGVSANPWISRRYGFDRGFDTFADARSTRRAPPAGGLASWRWMLQAVRARIDDGLAQAEAVTSSWIDDLDGSPFFWFVNLMECHSPYLPPRPYNDLSVLGRILAARDARRYQSHSGFFDVCLGRSHPSDASFARMRHLYDRSVSAMDAWLGRVLERLDAAGALDDTIVVVTSDHGENFGEGHLFGHIASVDDRLIRVPLVLAGPDAGDGPQGVWTQASLPARLADAVGMDAGRWPVHDDGVAVAHGDGFPVLQPSIADALVEAWDLDDEAVDVALAPRACATDGRFKLVRTASKEVLYDLEADPLEVTDVLSAQPEAASRLRAALEASGPEPAPASASRDAEISDDLEERMRTLGYM